MNDLKNKNIIITGASSGIGSELVKTFSNFRSNIILLSRNIEELNKIIKSINKGKNQSITCYQLDITVIILIKASR